MPENLSLRNDMYELKDHYLSIRQGSIIHISPTWDHGDVDVSRLTWLLVIEKRWCWQLRSNARSQTVQHKATDVFIKLHTSESGSKGKYSFYDL